MKRMPPRSDVRLIARVARLYYEGGLKQPEIAERLRISQAKVSRLLRQALEHDIVRITVRVPLGVHAELEEALEQQYGLTEAVVVDTTSEDEARLMQDLGQAAAYHLETTIRSDEIVGISSWSATLLATVNAMRPVSATNVKVVQVLGGVGDPAAEVHATELTRRLAELLRGDPVLLPVPGVVGSAAARSVLEQDQHVRRAIDLFSEITVALVGIGSVEPSPLLARSGNVFSAEELEAVAGAGAVGDVCLRFFDRGGRPLATEIDERVIGLTLDDLRRVPRSIAVAGGRRKVEAIRGALTGRLVTHLITDRTTALALAGAEQPPTAAIPGDAAGDVPR
jgi:DNA-binding transcriptional regulator LsrR (DeoR family)